MASSFESRLHHQVQTTEISTSNESIASSANLLESVQEQQLQFSKLTQEIEEEKRAVQRQLEMESYAQVIETTTYTMTSSFTRHLLRRHSLLTRPNSLYCPILALQAARDHHLHLRLLLAQLAAFHRLHLRHHIYKHPMLLNQ